MRQKWEKKKRDRRKKGGIGKKMIVKDSDNVLLGKI